MMILQPSVGLLAHFFHQSFHFASRRLDLVDVIVSVRTSTFRFAGQRQPFRRSTIRVSSPHQSEKGYALTIETREKRGRGRVAARAVATTAFAAAIVLAAAPAHAATPHFTLTPSFIASTDS